MSFLISDSLVGIVDETALTGGQETLGSVKIDDMNYEIDAFLADQKSLRCHVLAPLSIALDLMKTLGKTVSITLGSHKTQGQVVQSGWDNTDRGGRVILCVTNKIDNR
jgi:hypothetical protein